MEDNTLNALSYVREYLADMIFVNKLDDYDILQIANCAISFATENLKWTQLQLNQNLNQNIRYEQDRILGKSSSGTCSTDGRADEA